MEALIDLTADDDELQQRRFEEFQRQFEEQAWTIRYNGKRLVIPFNCSDGPPVESVITAVQEEGREKVLLRGALGGLPTFIKINWGPRGLREGMLHALAAIRIPEGTPAVINWTRCEDFLVNRKRVSGSIIEMAFSDLVPVSRIKGRADKRRCREAAIRLAKAYHARGIAHGDLNDGNILCDMREGRVVFIDWELGALDDEGIRFENAVAQDFDRLGI